MYVKYIYNKWKFQAPTLILVKEWSRELRYRFPEILSEAVANLLCTVSSCLKDEVFKTTCFTEARKGYHREKYVFMIKQKVKTFNIRLGQRKKQ